jgi:thiol-disulfide isomerase/thioredoxin
MERSAFSGQLSGLPPITGCDFDAIGWIEPQAADPTMPALGALASPYAPHGPTTERPSDSSRTRTAESRPLSNNQGASMSPMNRGLIAVTLSLALLPACKPARETPAPVSSDAAGGTAGAAATSTTIPAPDFSLPDLEGNRVELAQFKGKVLVIDFWATWCPPCRDAIPELIAMKKKYGPRGFDIVGISMDENPARVVPPFIEHYGINYPVVMADAQVSSDFGGIVGLPTTFIVDRGGNIAERYIGYVDLRVIEEAVEGLL